MKDNLFDDFVREKLEHYDSGVPTHLWQKIQPHIQDDDDDTGAFIWFRRLLPAILLLLGISGVTYFLLTRNNTGNKNDLAKSNNDNSITDVKNSTLNNNSNNNTATLTLAADQSKSDKAKQNSFATNDQPVINSDNSSLSNLNLPAENNKNHNNSTDNKKGNLSINNNHSPNFFADNNSGTLMQQRSSDNKDQTHISLRDLVLKKMNWNKMSLLNPRKDMGTLMEQTSRSGAVVNGCPTIYGPRRNNLYLEIYGSPDNNFRKFQSFGNQSNYIDHRKDQEKTNFSYSAGVRIAKNLGENLVGKTGINYSQINESLNYINAKETKLVQIITIRTIINSPGDTLFINDTSYFEQQGTRIRKTYNRYRFIDVPVILSYEFNPESSLTIAVNGGLIFNVAAVYSGEILDTTLAPVKINTDGNSPVATWKKSIGLGLYGSLGFYKRVSDRMQIMFEPYIRYNLKNVNKNQAVVNQRYTTTGIQLGVRFDIHKRQRWEK